MPDRRRTFGPVVLAGLVGSGLATLAGSKPWAAPDGTAGSTLVDKTGGHVPLASALGLVALAGWGVLLVTRGRVRRAVAVLVAVVSAGLVATTLLGRSSALDSARRATVDLGETVSGAHVTGWWWVAVPASLLALVAAVAAVLWCRLLARDGPSVRRADGSRYARRPGRDGRGRSVARPRPGSRSHGPRAPIRMRTTRTLRSVHV